MRMLVLTRRWDEAITVDHAGETLEITVVYLGGNKVRLGFTGPESFAIARDDVVRRPRDRGSEGR
jgi:carbon storage regulator CsrA